MLATCELSCIVQKEGGQVYLSALDVLKICIP